MVSKELLLRISAYFGGLSSGLLIAMLDFDSAAISWILWLSLIISASVSLGFYLKAYLDALKKEYDG